MITLSIIGVVAALTIPSLVVKKEKQELVAGLQKTYTVLSNAIIQVNRDGGFNELENIGDGHIAGEIALNEISKYLKIIKFCPRHTNQAGCPLNDISRITLSDGSYIGCWWPSYLAAPYQIGTSGRFFIDVNGEKGPNVSGKDIFILGVDIATKKLLPYFKFDNTNSCNDQELKDQCFKDGKVGTNPENCAYKIINEGWQMNY